MDHVLTLYDRWVKHVYDGRIESKKIVKEVEPNIQWRVVAEDMDRWIDGCKFVWRAGLKGQNPQKKKKNY